MSRKAKRIFSEAGGDGHRDVPYGVYDRPGPTTTAQQLPNFQPVVPKEQVAIQLSVGKPPVDDKEYVPVPGRDLGLALAALAEKVPDESIESFYKEVRRLVSNLSTEELDESRKRNFGDKQMKNRISKMKISEAGPPGKRRHMVGKPASSSAAMPVASMRRDFESEYGTGEELDVEEEQSPEADAPEGSSLKELMELLDMSSPGGPANLLAKVMVKLRRLLEMPPTHFQELVDYAANEYIRVLSALDVLEPEQAADLKKNKALHVKSLASFRMFLNKAFYDPAISQLEKDMSEKLAPYFDRMGLPEDVKSTFLKQLYGYTDRDPAAIWKLLSDASKKGNLKVNPDKVYQMLDLAKSELDDLVADASSNLKDLAVSNYKKTGMSTLENILKKASDDPFAAEMIAKSDEDLVA